MKSIFFLFVIALVISSCQNKKLETANPENSVAVDTVVQSPAVQLAFSPVDGYALKSTVRFPDSVTFLILAGQAEFEDLFAPAKTANEVSAPDFIINHTIVIATQPTDTKTTLEVEKVELGESTINVFAKITRGEKESITSTPARVFSIEKRDGVTGIDFYLNGKVASSLMLPSF